ncbi:universal stress protein A-like protein [Rutidosis leptorrhynchoides]|uniref:universal stress protein A-like protein n=1 Tax=Rutidosis leptorrhynchoides TaxID=125765 RepID=UPI003A9A3142
MEETTPIIETTAAQEFVQVQKQEKIMKVMVAIDESEGSLYALQWALENLFRHRDIGAPADDGSPLITVVHVQPPFQMPYTAVPVGPVLFATPAVMDSVKKAQEESASEVLSHASKVCEQHRIKAQMMVIRGNPKDMIVEAVEQINVDLLVVGSRGLGQIKRAFLGSVSDYCVHHAKCPVLIVRPPKSSNK